MFDDEKSRDDPHHHARGGHDHHDSHAHAHAHGAGYMDAYGLDRGWSS